MGDGYPHPHDLSMQHYRKYIPRYFTVYVAQAIDQPYIYVHRPGGHGIITWYQHVHRVVTPTLTNPWSMQPLAASLS